MLSFRCHCFLCEQLLTERDQCNPFLSPNFTQILSHWYYFFSLKDYSRAEDGGGEATLEIWASDFQTRRALQGHLHHKRVLWLTTARVFCSKFITHCSHWLGSNFLNLNLSEEANCAAQMYPARGTESNSFHIKYFSRSTESSHQSF